ncbi:MAG: DUF2383 domain-containing protein [Chitinophagales bacterium]
MHNKKIALKIISKLIHANERRSEVYRRCYNRAPSTDLKIIFNKYYSSSITNINALTSEVLSLGYKAPLEETANEMIFKVLLELRDSISGNAAKWLMNDCVDAEARALYAYYKAMESKELLHHFSIVEKLSVQMEEISEAKESLINIKTNLAAGRLKIYSERSHFSDKLKKIDYGNK